MHSQEKSYLGKKKVLSVTKKAGINMTQDGHFQSFKMFLIKGGKKLPIHS